MRGGIRGSRYNDYPDSIEIIACYHILDAMPHLHPASPCLTLTGGNIDSMKSFSSPAVGRAVLPLIRTVMMST